MRLTQTHYEIIKFVIVGGINTLNYYIVYLLLLKLLNVNYLVSHVTGFIVSFIISYYLNCYFVYKVKPTLKSFEFSVNASCEYGDANAIVIHIRAMVSYFFRNCTICRISNYNSNYIHLI